MDKRQEHILCAAIHVDDGDTYKYQPTGIKTGFVVSGRRHHDCYYTIAILKPHLKDKMTEDRAHQGFLTSQNRYVNRREAYLLAKAYKQLLLPPLEDDKESILISEDLY